jgi:hypothetical protein
VRITITDRLVGHTANEGQAVPFTVKVWTDTAEPWVLVAPTTLRYRVDNPQTGEQILDWTSGSASSSQTITVTGALNTLYACAREPRQLTVQADVGLSTVSVATREFYVRALAGVAA